MYIIYRLDILLFSKSAKFQIHNLPGFICLNLRHIFVCSHILHEIKKAFFFFFFFLAELRPIYSKSFYMDHIKIPDKRCCVNKEN